jgi:hypothetical protein
VTHKELGTRGAGEAPVAGDGRRRATRRRAVVALAAVALLGAAACGSRGDDESPGATESSPAASAPVGVVPVPGPGVMVKVDDSAAGRSGHAGVADAEMVIEEPLEAGLGRLAVIQTVEHPSRVGPVRSLRPPDRRFTDILGGVTLAYSGAQPGIAALVAKGPATLVAEANGGGVWTRDSTRRAPHNLYVDAAKLAADAGPASPFFGVGGPPASGGMPASRISVEMRRSVPPSGTVWTYDAAAERWQRGDAAGRPLSDADGTRQQAESLVVLQMRTTDSGFDAQGGQPVPDLELPGRGTGWLLHGPQGFRVTWVQSAPAAAIVLTADDGVQVGPTGQTWVALVPDAAAPSG